MIKKFLLVSIFITYSACLYASGDSFSDRREVHVFIQEMHKKHGFNEKELHSLFAKFSPDKKIITLMSKQYEALPWYQYRNRLVTRKQIRAGVDFMREHKNSLEKAEKKTGVPAEVIVSIIGVETRYGKNMGSFPVIQSLATLAFDYPRRAKFFRSELEHFLLLAKEGSLDPATTKGSFAGAIGMPQFMPSSYRNYGVAASGNGKRDLVSSVDDTILSVANYLKKNGWKSGEKTIIDNIKPSKNLSGLSTHHDLKTAELANYKIKTPSKKILSNNKKMKIIVLQKSKNTRKYCLGLTNFYTIMRYYNSVHYAMAVHELSDRIRKLNDA